MLQVLLAQMLQQCHCCCLIHPPHHTDPLCTAPCPTALTMAVRVAVVVVIPVHGTSAHRDNKQFDLTLSHKIYTSQVHPSSLSPSDPFSSLPHPHPPSSLSSYQQKNPKKPKNQKKKQNKTKQKPTHMRVKINGITVYEIQSVTKHLHCVNLVVFMWLLR